MDFSEPPPTFAPPMGPPGGFVKPNTIRHPFKSFHYQPRVPYVPQLPLTQDDFDGKRLRKTNMRKTVDYNAAIIKALQYRVWQRDWRDRPALQPDAMYTPDLLPPPSYIDNPTNAVTTKFVRTASNKMRCPIFTLAWTPEGRRLVTGASSGEFTLWNGLTFNFETILQAHEASVRSMVWSHNEGWMVTGDHAGFIKYWQSNMNNVKMYQAHKEAVRGISFSPTDSKIVTCSDDGTLRIFDFFRCQEERILRGHGADVKCVQWHPYKGLIVSGSKDNQQPIKLWDPKSGQALCTLHAHKFTVMDLKWNDNGNWLITASRDHLLKLFDIRKLGSEVQIFRGHKKEASSVSWHPVHEGLFCSGGSDGSVLFWNVGTDKEVGSIEGAHESLVWTLAWHPLGHILASGSNDHSSKFWTRNRPGDPMRDKYNLNTLPAGVLDDHDLEDIPAIPGMGPEDKVEIFSTKDKEIPGLDLDTSVIPIDMDKKVKKVPYSKPIPKSFQVAWNHGVGDVSLNSDWTQNAENIPGAILLEDLKPTGIYIYGKLLPVEENSLLEQAIKEGPAGIRKLIMSGDIEELDEVRPHFQNEDDDETFKSYNFPSIEEIEDTLDQSKSDLHDDENTGDRNDNSYNNSRYDDDYDEYPQQNFGRSRSGFDREPRNFRQNFRASSDFRSRNFGPPPDEFDNSFGDNFDNNYPLENNGNNPPSLLSLPLVPPPSVFPQEDNEIDNYDSYNDRNDFNDSYNDNFNDNDEDSYNDYDDSMDMSEGNNYAPSMRRGGFRNTNGVRGNKGGAKRGRGGPRKGGRGVRGQRGNNKKFWRGGPS